VRTGSLKVWPFETKQQPRVTTSLRQRSWIISTHYIYALRVTMGRAGRYGDRIPVGVGRDFPHPSSPAHPAFPARGYVVSIPGVKRSVHGVDHPRPSSAEVKERLGVYLYPPVGFRGLLQGKFYKFFGRTVSIYPAGSSKTLFYVYKTARCHTAGYINLYIYTHVRSSVSHHITNCSYAYAYAGLGVCCVFWKCRMLSNM